MKKIMKKVLKLISVIGVFMFSMPKKVLSVVSQNFTYGDDVREVLYAPIRSPLHSFFKITRNFIVPFAFLIGIFIYFKKSKSSTKRKIITLIISLILVCLVCYGLSYFI